MGWVWCKQKKLRNSRSFYEKRRNVQCSMLHRSIPKARIQNFIYCNACPLEYNVSWSALPSTMSFFVKTAAKFLLFLVLSVYSFSWISIDTESSQCIMPSICLSRHTFCRNCLLTPSCIRLKPWVGGTFLCRWSVKSAGAVSITSRMTRGNGTPNFSFSKLIETSVRDSIRD